MFAVLPTVVAEYLHGQGFGTILVVVWGRGSAQIDSRA